MARAAASKVFLTMHGIGGDDRARDAEFGEKLLKRWDLVGFLVALDMAEHETGTRGEGAENMRRLAVGEMVEAVSQGLAIDRDMTGLIGRRSVSRERRRVTTQHALDRSRIELCDDASDRRVGGSLFPFQAEKIA